MDEKHVGVGHEGPQPRQVIGEKGFPVPVGNEHVAVMELQNPAGIDDAFGVVVPVEAQGVVNAVQPHESGHGEDRPETNPGPVFGKVVLLPDFRQIPPKRRHQSDAGREIKLGRGEQQVREGGKSVAEVMVVPD